MKEIFKKRQIKVFEMIEDSDVIKIGTKNPSHMPTKRSHFTYRYIIIIIYMVFSITFFILSKQK